MKRNWILAAGLTLALCLSLAAGAGAKAAVFPDVADHWSKEYVMEMTEAGLFRGYEDGTFRPDATLTAMEALTLCARVAESIYGLDSNTVAKMTAARREELEELLDEGDVWFAESAAVALETGILTWEDLFQRVKADALDSPLQKELFSVYLVRAMGLDTLARNLPKPSLDFADADEITGSYVPYVYLLKDYGVLIGDENNQFNPAQPLDRAVSATMLSRVLKYAGTEGLAPELAEYTDYTWRAGFIVQAAAGEKGFVDMELTNALSGDWKTAIPDTAAIYLDDRAGTAKDLKIGLYAKVCYDSEENIFAVRLYDPAGWTTVSGTVTKAGQDSVTLQVEGEDVICAINRFTETSVGGKAGGRERIDPEGGYASADICYDASGRAVSAAFQGGTRLEEGLISQVATPNSGETTLQLLGFDGVTRRYILTEDAQVTINQLSGSLSSSHAGFYAALRVLNDTPDQAVTVEINTLAKYIQGTVRSRTYSRPPYAMSVADMETRKGKSYTVLEDAEIYYEGKPAALKDLSVDDFVTIGLTADGEIQMASAWPGTVETRGELADIAYGITTVLTVLQEDGTTMQFDLDMQNIPPIERDGAASTLIKLCAGDQVTVTVRYQEITRIQAVSQDANAVGTIESVTHALGSSTLTVTLEDGTTQTYTVDDSVALTQDGTAISRTTLQPGSRLSMVVNNGAVLSAQVESAGAASAKISGVALSVDVTAKTVLFQLDDGSVINVIVDNATKYTQATGTSLTLRSLGTGDGLTIYGEYQKGEFHAALIIRE